MHSSSAGFWRNIADLYRIMGRHQRREVWTVLMLTVVGAFAEVVTIGAVVPFLTLLSAAPAKAHMRWIGALFSELGARSRPQELLAATVLLCAAAVASAMLRLLLVRRTQDFASSFGHRLSVEVQRRMLLQPYSWHVRHNSSEQLAAIEKAELVTGSVLLPLMQAAAATVLVIVVLLLLLSIAPLATVIVGAVLGGGYYAVGVMSRRRLQIYSGEVDEAFDQRIRLVQEGLAGIRDLILDGSQGRVVERFRAIDWQLARARANAVFAASVPRYLMEPAGVIAIAALAVFLSGRDGGLIASLPVLGALALGAQRLLPLVQQLYNGWSSVAANSDVVEDVVRRLSLALPPGAPATDPLDFERTIEFRDVSYTYADRVHPAVEGLSFTIRRGSRVALVGPTGSGKSTTADLLMGLVDPSSGVICVDGVALTNESRQSWRASIAHVPQILFVADATVAQNIALSAEPDMERVRAAAAAAQIEPFVASLPDGYETRVGERGARISGGQRQRLAIARAIYKDTPLLVFDEATSALDAATESAVLRSIELLQQKGRTVVIIAHRLTTTGAMRPRAAAGGWTARGRFPALQSVITFDRSRSAPPE